MWAQDKWKGVFKVRWIFIRDIPNAILRGIKLEYAILSIYSSGIHTDTHGIAPETPRNANLSPTLVILKSYFPMRGAR